MREWVRWGDTNQKCGCMLGHRDIYVCSSYGKLAHHQVVKITCLQLLFPASEILDRELDFCY